MNRWKSRIGIIIIMALCLQLSAKCTTFAAKLPEQNTFLSFRIYNFDGELPIEEREYQEFCIVSGQVQSREGTGLLKDCYFVGQQDALEDTVQTLEAQAEELASMLATYPTVEGASVIGWDVFTREIEAEFAEAEQEYASGMLSDDELERRESALEHTTWKREAPLEEYRMDTISDAKDGYIKQITLFPRFNQAVYLVTISNLVNEQLRVREQSAWEALDAWETLAEQDREAYIREKLLEYQPCTNQTLHLEDFEVVSDGLRLELKARYQKNALILHYKYDCEEAGIPEEWVVFYDANQQVDEAFLNTIFKQNVPEQLEGDDDAFFQWQIMPKPGITEQPSAGLNDEDKSINELYLMPDYNSRQEVTYIYRIAETGETFQRNVLFAKDASPETIEANGRTYLGKFAKEHDVKAWKFVKKTKNYYILENVTLKEAVSTENTESTEEKRKEKSAVVVTPDEKNYGDPAGRAFKQEDNASKETNLGNITENSEMLEAGGQQEELEKIVNDTLEVQATKTTKNFWKQLNTVYKVLGGIAVIGVASLIAGTIVVRKKKNHIL